MTKIIDNALGLSSVNEPEIIDDYGQKLPAVRNELTEQSENDVEYARENLYTAVEKSYQAVEDMLAIAQQSQHPKAYEVLNSAIKTLADISMGLADLQLKKQRLQGRKETAGDPQTVNNNLFVGSTAELQKMLENLKNNNEN
jgi:hypothetical protein